MFVYPVRDAKNDLKAIMQSVLDKFQLTEDGTAKKIQVAGQDALQFSFHYSNDSGDFTGKAFAIYRDDLKIGLVFSAEAKDQKNTDTLYQLFLDHLNLIDVNAILSKDTGVWGSDSFTDETSYPVAESWLPGKDNDNGWWYYRPDNATTGTTFAAVTVYKQTDESASDFLNDILTNEIEPASSGYSLEGTDTYYGELNTWETAKFSHKGPNGEPISGQVYVTIKNGVPYALWFEAPDKAFDQTFRDTFTVMLDGFTIEDKTSSTDGGSGGSSSSGS